jgi:hypothetical protein
MIRCARSVRIRLTFCIAQKVTMVRPALAQPCATAHQPMLVALKTRLFIQAFIWLPGMLARLFMFHIRFLSFVEPIESCLSMKPIGRAARTV